MAKKNKTAIVIIIAIISVLIVLGITSVIVATIFFDMPWEKVKQDTNYEWNNIVEDNQESEILEEDEVIDTTPILETTKDGKAAVYLFRGEGCPHCADAETWFESIKGEYGDKFILIDYETWYNEENNNLMKKVAKSRGETVRGVPYIIIGNKSWEGFTESYESEMLSEIKRVYELY